MRQYFKCPYCSASYVHDGVRSTGVLCKKEHRLPSGKLRPGGDEVWMQLADEPEPPVPVRKVKRRART